MPQSKRFGRRATKAGQNQKHTSDIARGNRGYVADKRTSFVPTNIDRRDGKFSPGKIVDPDAISKYADAIGGNLRRGVEAFLEIGRLCAGEEERFDPAQQAELKCKLPFSEATFSKFRQIGLNTRLRKPEVQRLLPAAYTTIYAISRLNNDDDLSAAMTEKIINPDMKRGEFEKWAKEREAARQQKAHKTDSAAEQSDSVNNDAPVPTVDAPPVVPAAPSEPTPATTGALISASAKSECVENIASALVEPSLSNDDQAVLELLNETWDHASDLVRAEFRARIGRPGSHRSEPVNRAAHFQQR